MIRVAAHAVLFDLDGVLVDSSAGNERAWHAWAAGHGLDGASTFALGHGLRTADHIREVAPELATPAEVRRLDALEARESESVTAQPGVTGLPARLGGILWGVVTSCSPEAAARRLDVTGLHPPVLVCSTDVAHGKPSPEGYLLGARRLRTPPASVVVVEDAPSGVAAAKRAGMRVVALGTTHARTRLSEADWYADDLAAVAFHPVGTGAGAEPALISDVRPALPADAPRGGPA
ncbi:HAD-IA family hydrolase [Streptomyces sp. NPDC050610]|uniref:HAD-IA family hydrolase n=1 Tax=Streptomyces sp. NPDC050610 TaxID=3157097 RepID=UPI003413A180